MCQTAEPVAHVRIIRCAHGSNFVTLGNVTLCLDDNELVLLDRAIHKLARQQPVLQQRLYEGLCANNSADPEASP